MITPTDEELEQDLALVEAQIANLDAASLREGYLAMARMNGLLRRQLCEAISMARVIYVGEGPVR